jgi:hypothetical protein
MPYRGAFVANSEAVLSPYAPRIAKAWETLLKALDGERAPEGMPGDLSFVAYPLPRIALAYVFYLPDDEFPASAACLFSANARSFMPLDGLADVAEYTAKRIIELLQKP